MLILTILVFSGSALAQTPVTQLNIIGDPNDPISMGHSFTFTPSDGAFNTLVRVFAPGTSPSDVEAVFNSNDRSQSWQLRFSTAQGSQELVPGFYGNASLGFGDGTHPGLEVAANAYGCGGITGSFTIIDATFSLSGGQYQLASFAAQFEQHCDGFPPALRGTFYYNYTPPVVPTILTYTTPPNGQVGQPYSAELLMVGGTAPVTWNVASGQLPPGVALSPGQLQGTPTKAGSYTFSIGLGDAAGHTSQSGFTIAVDPQTKLPPVTQLVLNGCKNCYLLGPTQLSFTPNDGLFILQTLGTSGIRIRFEGTNYGATGNYAMIDFNAEALLDPTLKPGYYPTAVRPGSEQQGEAGFDLNVGDRGCNEESATFTILDINVDYSSRIPTVLSFAATFVQNECQDGGGPVTGQIYYNYEQPVNPTVVTFSQLPEADVSVPYTNMLIAAGGIAPYKWQLAGGQMPPGLALGSDGAVTGTPTQGGVYSFTAQVIDKNGHSGQSNMSLPVIQALAITPPVLPAVISGQPFQTTLTAAGGSPPYTFSLAQGQGLPPGLKFDASGNLSGTPLVSGHFVNDFVVTDSRSRKASLELPLSVLTRDGAQGVRRLTLSQNQSVQGQNYFFNSFYADSDGVWGADAIVDPATGQVNGISVGIQTGPGYVWDLQFSTSQLGMPLVPGVYNNAEGVGSAEPGHPGIFISQELDGTLEGCNIPTGSFTVLNAVFDMSGGTARVVSFAAQFQEFCNGGTIPQVSGTIFYGVQPPVLGPQAPSISSVRYKAKRGQLTVTGNNINSQCSLLIDGHEQDINLIVPGTEIGPAIKATGVKLPAGAHLIQVANVNGDLSLPFQLTVQ